MELEIPANETGTRIDMWLKDKAADISRTSLQRMLASGEITVNGLTVPSSYKTRYRDIVRINIPAPKAVTLAPEDIPLSVVYEDEHLIVVNKPKGMVVHPAPGHHTGTLVNALLHHCGENLSGINGELRPGIVHRLDKDTTGLLVAAKSDSAHRSLSGQLAGREISRRYLCIAAGRFDSDEFAVNKPIARHKTDRKKMSIDPSGRHAVTRFKVLERYTGSKYALLEASLETGRTHQIRVHLASLNRPVLGDIVYGSEKQPFDTNGQVLHAYHLKFVHPATGLGVEFNAAPPPYFAGLMERLRT